MKDPRYEPWRAKAEELLMGNAKLTGAADISDNDLEEAIIEHIAGMFFWVAADAKGGQ
jgi:hypothetical protein